MAHEVRLPLAALVPNADIQSVNGSDPTDEDLIVAIARGETLALAKLYGRHGPQLLSVARRILTDNRESEDLLHDTFVEVWRVAGDFDPARGSARAWLLLRLRSRGLDRLRKSRKLRASSEPELLDESPVSAPQPRLSDSRRVCSALDRLHPEKRQVLELGYFAGFSAGQIASHLGIPIGTVKSRTAAAIAELRVMLGAVKSHEVGS